MANILVMDDDGDILELFKYTLEPLGHTLFTETNADLGAKIYLNEKLDIIFTDLLIPQKDGIEALLEISHLANPPKIVTMSGEGSEYLDVTKDLGAEITLTKPLTRDMILTTLDTLGV
ncbi:MAG: response regulator [Candidatus Latescibacterota bacterium]